MSVAALQMTFWHAHLMHSPGVHTCDKVTGNVTLTIFPVWGRMIGGKEDNLLKRETFRGCGSL